MLKTQIDFYNQEVARVQKEAVEILNQGLTSEQILERQRNHTITIAGLQSLREELKNKGVNLQDPLGAEGLGRPS